MAVPPAIDGWRRTRARRRVGPRLLRRLPGRTPAVAGWQLSGDAASRDLSRGIT